MTRRKADPGIPAGARLLPRALCRPAEPALFRRAPDPASRRRRKIYLKRDELNHTGAHKINNCMGQILLARRMGKTRIIAETGAGQHGVATATVCALFGLPCTVYMGETDIERQKPNVFRMKLLGAEVRAGHVRHRAPEGRDERGAARLGRQCRATPSTSSAPSAGPHPYPAMVRDFQCVIGNEVRAQMLEAEGRLPDIAGRLHRRRLERHGPVPSVPRRCRASQMIGVEAAGHGVETRQACRLARTAAGPACCTATAPICCRTRTARSPKRIRSRPGSTIPASGRSMPGCTTSAASNTSPATDDEALDAFQLLHAARRHHPRARTRARAGRMWPSSRRRLPPEHLIVINLSGRGDKDIFTVAKQLGRRRL